MILRWSFPSGRAVPGRSWITADTECVIAEQRATTISGQPGRLTIARLSLADSCEPAAGGVGRDVHTRSVNQTISNQKDAPL